MLVEDIEEEGPKLLKYSIFSLVDIFQKQKYSNRSF